MWSTHQRIDKDTLLHCKTMHYFLYLSHCWLLQFAERLSPVVSQYFKSHFWRSHFKQKPTIQQPHNWYFQRTERRCPVKTVSTLHRCKSRMHCNQLIVCVSDGQTAYAIDWSRNFSACSRTRRSYSARFWLQPTTNQNTCIFHTATMTPVQRPTRDVAGLTPDHNTFMWQLSDRVLQTLSRLPWLAVRSTNILKMLPSYQQWNY